MTNITRLPFKGTTAPPPKRLRRPAHYGLRVAIDALESQAGTVEAYNALCEAAEELKAAIDADDITSPNEHMRNEVRPWFSRYRLVR